MYIAITSPLQIASCLPRQTLHKNFFSQISIKRVGNSLDKHVIQLIKDQVIFVGRRQSLVQWPSRNDRWQACVGTPRETFRAFIVARFAVTVTFRKWFRLYIYRSVRVESNFVCCHILNLGFGNTISLRNSHTSQSMGLFGFQVVVGSLTYITWLDSPTF